MSGMHNVQSLPREIKHGVPEGSILEAALFLFFRNDLLQCLNAVDNIFFGNGANFRVEAVIFHIYL